MTDTHTKSPLQLIGLILCRAVVPLWVMTGAIFKLTEKTPRLLPESIWRTAYDFEVNLYVLLAVLIVIELTLAGIMFFMARLARPAAIFTLAVFCVVLIVEMLRGATNCGCLGGFSPPPWLMLTIDGAMLLGVVAFAPPRPEKPEWLPSGPATVTAMWILGVLSITAAMVLPEMSPNDNVIAPNGSQAKQNTGDANNDNGSSTATQTKPMTIPSVVATTPSNWIDKQWSQIEFSRYVTGWPSDLDTGRQYVIFYSRTCEQCHELLQYFFYDPPVNTTIVAIPEFKSGFDTDNAMPVDCPGCLELELPVGTEWLITPPMVIALEDGVVKCAAESVETDTDEPECLIWH